MFAFLTLRVLVFLWRSIRPQACFQSQAPGIEALDTSCFRSEPLFIWYEASLRIAGRFFKVLMWKDWFWSRACVFEALACWRGMFPGSLRCPGIWVPIYLEVGGDLVTTLLASGPVTTLVLPAVALIRCLYGLPPLLTVS